MSSTTHESVGLRDLLRDVRHMSARAASDLAQWLVHLELEGKADRSIYQYHRTAAALLREYPDHELAAFIKSHFGSERAILAGNSIMQDRLFIKRYMPLTDAQLHYRQVDVTSWKVIFNEIYDMRFKKKDTHRALDDILESIEELKFYMNAVKSPG